MRCLYCGKEIGAIQSFRDEEFCNSAHRQAYAGRLAKALRRVGLDEPAPAEEAGFLGCSRIQSGNARHAAHTALGMGGGAHRIELPRNWAPCIPAVLGDSFRGLAPAGPEAPRPGSPSIACDQRRISVRNLRADLEGLRLSLQLRDEDPEPASPEPQLEPPCAVAEWIASPAPEPVEREISWAAAQAECEPLKPNAPELRLEISAPCVAPAFGWQPCPAAEPVMREVAQIAAAEPETASSSAALLLPGFAGIEPATEVTCAREVPTMRPVMPAPSGFEMTPAAANLAALVSPIATAAPELTVGMPAAAMAKSGDLMAGEQAEPVERELNWRISPEPEVALVSCDLPAFSLNPAGDAAPSGPAQTEEQYQVAELMPLEYHSQRVHGHRRIELRWMARRVRILLPVFRLGLALDESLRLAYGRRPGRGPAAVVQMQHPERPDTSRKRWRAAGAIAAGLFAGAVIWGGIDAVRTGAGLKWDASSPVARGARSAKPRQLAAVARKNTQPKGPKAWVQAAAARRAAIEVSDRLALGMEAWGMPANTWAPGWSRHRDGYVRPGQLALFNPSMGFKDYRLEFFGQIDAGSMSWVVRARDRRNFHAMKFKVVDAGLRPVLAMVHYPVVGGKPGRKTEIPLSVMIHRDEPYRVAVNVKGNRIQTSINGETVDSWTEPSAGSGGIGFFSDAGERARLYWMKVAANDDFVGRICAYVADALGQEAQTAALWPGRGAPKRRPMPANPQSAALATAGAAFYFSKDRRMQSWKS